MKDLPETSLYCGVFLYHKTHKEDSDETVTAGRNFLDEMDADLQSMITYYLNT